MMKVRSSLSNNNMNSPVSLFIESEGSRKRLLEAFEPTVLGQAELESGRRILTVSKPGGQFGSGNSFS